MAVIADALVGELVKELLGMVIEMKDKARKFRSTLKKLQDTLESLGPHVDRVVQLSKKQERQWETEKLIELMKSGRELVLECSAKFPFWNRICKNAYYKEKLDELEESIFRYFQLNLQIQLVVIGLETLSEVNRSHCEQIGSAAAAAAFTVPPNEVQEEISVAVMRNERSRMNVCTALAPPEFTVGLDGPLHELKCKLLPQKATDSVRVITVTGSPGSGKTTLAKRFCWDDQVKGKFKENIFFVTFARNPKLNMIVHNLFKHNDFQVPNFQSEEDAMNQLESLMKQIGQIGPILLVLDDVWPESEALVDKFVFRVPNYNILVISRFAMARYGPPYVLERLSREDATSLFLHSASLNPGRTEIPDSVVKKIVKGCKHSPLALTVIGTSLRNKNLAVWRSMAKALSKGQSILMSNDDVNTSIQKYIDDLDSVAKECFKDLGLFPADQRIPSAALVDMWAELHGVDEETAMEIIYELVNRNLADIIVTRKVASDILDYNYHYVTQHDFLRELAICQISQEPEDKRNRLIIETNRNNLPAWWSLEKEHPIAARILSISTDEALSSEWCNLMPTKVEALVLNLLLKKFTLPMFMKKMNKLKVLTITNFDLYPAELENFEMLDHLSNLKRLRLEKVRIPFLSKTGVQLKNLQMCSFFMCNFYEASENCTAQVSNIWPNLVKLNFDYCTMVQLPDVLSDIVSLKYLRITNCHKLYALPEGIGKLVNLESLWLSSCSGLLELPQSITSLKKLQFLDISDCICLNNFPEDMGELKNLEKLNVRGCSSLTELPTSIMDLGNLKCVECDKEMAELWEPFAQILSDLRLYVAN